MKLCGRGMRRPGDGRRQPGGFLLNYVNRVVDGLGVELEDSWPTDVRITRHYDIGGPSAPHSHFHWAGHHRSRRWLSPTTEKRPGPPNWAPGEHLVRGLGTWDSGEIAHEIDRLVIHRTCGYHPNERFDGKRSVSGGVVSTEIWFDRQHDHR